MDIKKVVFVVVCMLLNPFIVAEAVEVLDDGQLDRISAAGFVVVSASDANGFFQASAYAEGESAEASVVVREEFASATASSSQSAGDDQDSANLLRVYTLPATVSSLFVMPLTMTHRILQAPVTLSQLQVIY